MSAKGKAHKNDVADHRAHPRVETCNLISFQCIDAAGTDVRQGMEKSLDGSIRDVRVEIVLLYEGNLVS